MKKLLFIFLAAVFTANLAQAQTKQNRNVGFFNKIDVQGAFTIYLRMGEKSAVTIIADDDIIEKVTTEVSNGELSIELDTDWWENMKTEKLEAYITVTELNELDLSGSCELITKNTITGKTLEIEASGATDIKGAFQYQSLFLDLSGASEINLTGKCGKLNVDASGACEINAVDLQAQTVNIDASGACEAKVYATKMLNIDASGACEVRYKGDPKVNKDISGAADVSPI